MLKLPGAFLSFTLICLVGIVLRNRVSKEAAGAKGEILLYTYYLYGALQFAGPFSPSIEASSEWGEHWLLLIFLVAQLAKVGNAIAMTGVLQAAVTNRDLTRERQVREAQQAVALKNAELEAQQVALRLEEANVEKRKQFVELGMLASSIKHDVSTPLATMGFDIEVLKNRYQHDKGISRKLENLERSMERIHAIVQVVDIFRGDQGFYDREQYMTKANMLEIVHRAVRSIKNEKKELKQADAKNKILVEGRDVWVRAYAPMFEQVIVNVIKNGLESIEEAGQARGLIKINVNTADMSEGPYSRWAKVEVEDNGLGIPAENMSKLTTIFTTRGDKKANSGIGLFIGKKIVDIHGGKIDFESTVGKGTKVTLLLPEWTALRRAEQQRAGGRPEADGDSQAAATENDAGDPAVAVSEREWVEEETYE
jgi:signal transduction histidine kinase